MENKTEITANRKQRRRKRVFYFFLIIFLVFFFGWFVVDQWARKHGFHGAGDFVKTVAVNYWDSFDANYETIEITISEEDYNKLSEQRELHLKRGVITKLEDRYVPALITYNGQKIKCRIRLKGHMTDHLQEGKWSFRIKTTKGDAFKGMRIFSLMHPGTRNYIYEWIYHQFLKQEGIATVRYSFLNLKLNGENWGIYAMEENFASELTDHSKLPEGPIIGFNPDLYWYARLQEHEKIKVDMNDLKIQSSFAEAYDEDDNFKNKESKKNYLAGFVLLEKFKRGEVKTSEVFDIDKLARFHAILDLVGGQFSLDWSDIKYYYNPITHKIEPVGYESFSVRNTLSLCGESRFKNSPDEFSEWHDNVFSDPDFFRLYINHLKRISKKEYLNQFFSRIQPELQNNLAILYAEFPYKKLPLKQYYSNQKNIKSILKKPIQPFVSSIKTVGNNLSIIVGATGTLPVGINSVLIGDKKIKPDPAIIIPARMKNDHIRFYSYTILLPQGIEKAELNKIKIELSELGDDKSVMMDVKPINFSGDLEDYKIDYEKFTFNNFDFITVDEERKLIVLKNGNHEIDSDLIIPSGYKVNFELPQQIDLINGASIVTFSPVVISGSEENPLIITSSDSTSMGIKIINAEGKSEINYLELNYFMKKGHKKNKALLVYESDVKINNSYLYGNSANGIIVYRSEVILSNSEISGFRNALTGFYSNLSVSKGLFFKNAKYALKLDNCIGRINNTKFKNSGTAIRLDNGCFCRINSVDITDAVIGIELTGLSKASATGIDLNSVKTGFIARKKSDLYGPAHLIVKEVKQKNVGNLKLNDKHSVINIK